MRAWIAPYSPTKRGLSLWQTVFVHRYCHRSWSLKINDVTQLSALRCDSAFSFSTDIIERLTPDPAFESKKPLFEPRMEMGLRIYVGLLLLTPKVPSLPFNSEDTAFLSWAPSYTAFHNWHNCWVCRALISWRLPMVGFSASRKGLSSPLWWHLTMLRWTDITMDIM